MAATPCPCCSEDALRRATGVPPHFMICRRCGFMTTIAQFPIRKKYVAEHYETVDPHRQIAHSKKYFFKHVLDCLGKPDFGTPSLLDIGCGYGYFLQLAVARGWKVNGVEIAPEAAKTAASAAGRRNIHLGTIREAGYADEAFAAVTLWDVLVFSEELEKDLRECFRVLRSGGAIGLRVRNLSFQKWLYRFCLPFIPFMRKLNIQSPYVFHPHNFTKASIQHILQRIGFVHIRVYNSPLTRGDPYRCSTAASLTGAAKRLIAGGAHTIYRLSGGRWTTAPSLLTWAEKPLG
jgi:SAM-dependent methyltransferase